MWNTSSMMKPTLNNLTHWVVGAGPLVRQMADEIGLIALVNRMLTWDQIRTKVSPGERIFAMVLDILLGHSPLYRVEDRLASTDVPLLLGEGRIAEDFSDDSLGRALDKLYDAGPKAVFTALGAQAFAHEALTTRSVHWDSTSRTLYGAYPGTPPKPAAVSAKEDPNAVLQPPPAVPRYGHSKDHRPDLKQLILSVLVTGDGVIYQGSVDAGNASDKALNRRAIADLAAAFSPEAMADLVYVADSSLVTADNLAALRQQGLAFISRCPETYGAVRTAKTAAWAADQWDALGTIALRRNAAQYWASEQSGEIEGEPYRFIVYRSSGLDAQKVKTLDRAIANARETLTRAAVQLSQQTFHCEHDAETAAAAFRKRPDYRWFPQSAVDITSRVERVSTGRGRPRKDAPTQTVWTVTATVGAVDDGRRQAEQQRRSTFVLITTLPPESWTAESVLREYKDQVLCERKFHFLKDPLFLDALFLDTPERLEALGYVILMAALLYSLLERRLRQNPNPIPSPVRRGLTRPTAHELFRHLAPVQTHLQPDGTRGVSLPERLHASFVAFLDALHLDERCYTHPPRSHVPSG